jgi:hypothetical protein
MFVMDEPSLQHMLALKNPFTFSEERYLKNDSNIKTDYN